MAKEGKGRTWCVTGDGSHQLTLNELGVMGRYGAKPVIFVLNNGIFGIEDVLSKRGHEYDEIAEVKYHLLPNAFGCKNWLCKKVGTVKELDEAFEEIATHDGAAYVEVEIRKFIIVSGDLCLRFSLIRGDDPKRREPAFFGRHNRPGLQT
jgi:indolepyruvate decarboxylase